MFEEPKYPTPVPTQLQQRNPPAKAAATAAIAEQKVTVVPATVKVVPASATLKVVPASATVTAVAAAEAPKKTYAQGP